MRVKDRQCPKKENPKSDTTTLESQIDSIVSRLHIIQ